jgi:AcrR family transcriptional regulator
MAMVVTSALPDSSHMPLVKRLGGSKATIYGYFASKEALFEAVVSASATGHLSDSATLALRDEIAVRHQNPYAAKAPITRCVLSVVTGLSAASP